MTIFNERMDGCMTCDISSFPLVCQSNQNDVLMIMKGCSKWNFIHG